MAGFKALENLKKDFKKLANPQKAKILQRFFKTGKGEYGEGDKFLGLVVPQQRQLVKKYWRDLNLKEVDKLLRSAYHEHRLVALLILVKKFEAADNLNLKSLIFKFYLSRTKYINNWDLVDLTAPKIVGAYLRNKNKSILLKLAKSKNLWQRRIAMLATFDFIYFKQPEWGIRLAKILLNDEHDLIQKAVGWMLREIGKRCREKYLTQFLNEHYKTMPRTALRYSIERLTPSQKKYYMDL